MLIILAAVRIVSVFSAVITIKINKQVNICWRTHQQNKVDVNVKNLTVLKNTALVGMLKGSVYQEFANAFNAIIFLSKRCKI